MEIGRIINERRIELGLTLEEIGNYVGVGKSTVKKWETGFIENMRRDKIKLLSHILNVSPLTFIYDELILSNENYQNNILSEPQQTTSMTIEMISLEQQQLLDNFNQLNTEGQERLLETSEELTEMNKYKKCDIITMGKKQA